MPTIFSYLNPFSSEHEAIKKYASLKPKQKALSVLTGFFVGLLTLPFLGIGGVLAFRKMVQKFHKINEPNILEPKTPIDFAAKKAASQAQQILKEPIKPERKPFANQMLKKDAKDFIVKEEVLNKTIGDLQLVLISQKDINIEEYKASPVLLENELKIASEKIRKLLYKQDLPIHFRPLSYKIDAKDNKIYFGAIALSKAIIVDTKGGLSISNENFEEKLNDLRKKGEDFYLNFYSSKIEIILKELPNVIFFSNQNVTETEVGYIDLSKLQSELKTT